MNKAITGTVFSAVLMVPLTAGASFFDFQGWTDTFGEQGFSNSSPFALTVDDLTLTATAFETSSGDDSHVYMDDRYHGITGGMGVCTRLDADAECAVASDDNVSAREVLRWEFDRDIAGMILEMGDDMHYDLESSDFYYRYGSSDWMIATTNNLGEVELFLDGMANYIEFKTLGPERGDNFYIRNAYVSSVPVPASVWLLGSGLLGFAGVARRRVS